MTPRNQKGHDMARKKRLSARQKMERREKTQAIVIWCAFVFVGIPFACLLGHAIGQAFI